MSNSKENSGSNSIVRPIDYVTLGVTVVSAVCSIYTVLNNAGVFTRKKEKDIKGTNDE